jgi:hypothetical protein
MVQALAFAEIFLGLILADAGYKGVTITSVVKGEAGETVAPNPLGGSATGGSTVSGAATAPPPPAGSGVEFGPKGELFVTGAQPQAGGANALNHPPASPFTTLTGTKEVLYR